MVVFTIATRYWNCFPPNCHLLPEVLFPTVPDNLKKLGGASTHPPDYPDLHQFRLVDLYYPYTCMSGTLRLTPQCPGYIIISVSMTTLIMKRFRSQSFTHKASNSIRCPPSQCHTICIRSRRLLSNYSVINYESLVFQQAYYIIWLP